MQLLKIKGKLPVSGCFPLVFPVKFLGKRGKNSLKAKTMLLFFCIFISLLGLSSGRADWHDTLLMKGSVATGTWRVEEGTVPPLITKAKEDGAGPGIEGMAGLQQTEINEETQEKDEQGEEQGSGDNNGSSGDGSETSAGNTGSDAASSSGTDSEEEAPGSPVGDEPAADISGDPPSADPPASETGAQDVETPSGDAGEAGSTSDGAVDGSYGRDEGDSSAESGGPADTE